MTQLEDRIRDSLRGTAGRLPDVVPVQVKRLRRVSGPMVAVAAMLVVFAVVGGLMWVIGSGGDDVAVGSITRRFPIPGYVPADADTVYGSYALHDPEDAAVIDSAVGRQTNTGFEDGVMVEVADGPDTSHWLKGEAVEVGGHQAWLLDEGDSGVSVWWDQGDLVVTVVAGNGDRSLALAVAGAVEVDGTGQFDPSIVDLGTLPQGLSIIAPPFVRPTDPSPIVSMETTPGRATVEMDHGSIEVWPGSPEQALVGMIAATRTEVRGHDGYLVAHPGSTMLLWAEVPGMTVSIGGTYPESEVRAIASGLEFTTQSEWESHYEIDETAFELPSTTTSLGD